MMPSRSRAVLVTGCSSGIGRATAERLAGAGWSVYASARRPATIADLAEHGCRLLALDVTDDASMDAAVRSIEEAEGAVGVLVNNAGVNVPGAVEAVPPDEWRRLFETNVFGPVALAQKVLPGMRAQGWGKIVTVGSMNGRLTFPAMGPYCATKHALEAVTDALRFEVRAFGIDVVLIQPGFVKTGFGEAAAARMQNGDGPYAELHAAVADSARSYTRGFIGTLAGDAEAIAAAIEKAVSSPRRPRARYRVTPSARLLMTTRHLLPDAAFDAVVGTSFPRPR